MIDIMPETNRIEDDSHRDNRGGRGTTVVQDELEAIRGLRIAIPIPVDHRFADDRCR